MSTKTRKQALAAFSCALAIAMGSASMLAGCSEQSKPSDTAESSPAAQTTASDIASATSDVSEIGSALDVTGLFTERDMEQVPDFTGAAQIELKSGEDVRITEEGVYVVTGNVEDVTIEVAADGAKVQLALNGVKITNASKPAICVESADKVFVTTTEGTENILGVTGSLAVEDDSIDGVIFSRDDLVLNGSGKLAISSPANGIVGNDDVKLTGGTYDIQASRHGVKANDLIAVAGGDYVVAAGSDALHCSNDEDVENGSVYIAGGTMSLNAGSDGISASSIVRVDGGVLGIAAAEGVEGTCVQFNGGETDIKASDDGINAAAKSPAYAVQIEINGGRLSVDMGQGDTDALDANGDLVINGGQVDITAQFAFDFDGDAELNGGSVTVNGKEVTVLENSMMGPGGQGGSRGMR